ncbi:hypothetical protein [Streptomyces sp. NPDC059009]|uniref:hypothetical protein n=1 Tax=Streptomyces sp. NPDC059009 TaxID=3346694 RepID=UPI0036806A13
MRVEGDRAPRRTRWTLAAALTTALALPAALTACDSGTSHSAATATPKPSAHTTSPAQICTNKVAYWARQVLVDAPNSGRDYMQKGLSNGENNILVAAVSAAKAERKRHGLASARKLIDRQVSAACIERNRNGPHSGNPWNPSEPANSHSA